MPITDFDIPFSAVLHPQVDELVEAHEKWLSEVCLPGDRKAVQSLVRCDLTQAIAWMWGNLSYERIRPICDLLGFIAILDDYCVRNKANPAKARHAVSPIIEITRDPGNILPTSTLQRAWLDMWRRIVRGAGMSAEWHRRALGDWREMFGRWLEETEEHASGTWPMADIDAYLHKRARSYGCALFLDVCECGNDIELPAKIVHDPKLLRMGIICFSVLSIVNDVVSLEREESEGERHNIIIQLRHRNRIGTTAAIRESKHMVTRLCREFLDLKSGLPELCDTLGTDAEQRRRLDVYVEAMERLMGGNYQWHRALPGRYRAENYTKSMKDAYLVKVEAEHAGGATT